MQTRIIHAAAVLVALLHGLMALSAAMLKSATFDEPTHFAAGYSYWLRSDFRLDPESGNLPQRWAAPPLLITRPKFVALEGASWRGGEQGDVGTKFLYDLGNDADGVLLQGRAMIALISVALCLLVYFWSKQLWGTGGAVISLIVAAFCPTLLRTAHW